MCQQEFVYSVELGIIQIATSLLLPRSSCNTLDPLLQPLT